MCTADAQTICHICLTLLSEKMKLLEPILGSGNTKVDPTVNQTLPIYLRYSSIDCATSTGCYSFWTGRPTLESRAIISLSTPLHSLHNDSAWFFGALYPTLVQSGWVSL